jgi:hypothetical protein
MARPAFVFVLYEHQSIDPMMPFRVLVYMVRIWQGWLRENPNARHLPPIVPHRALQRRRRWNAPLHMHGLFRHRPRRCSTRSAAFLPASRSAR